MKRSFGLAVAALYLGSSFAADAAANELMFNNPGESGRSARFTDQAYLYDIPLSSIVGGPARGSIDTLCWGNTIDRGDGIPIAERGILGLPARSQPQWDFEGGPFGDPQGWTSTDLTDLLQTLGVVPVRRVTSSSFSDPHDTDGTITAGGSTASVWFGALYAETRSGCWPGGQGYSNGWGLEMSKLFTYSGSGDVTIDIDYFVDSETQFDYSYVYVINADGFQSPVLNTSIGGRPDDGLGWSGSVQEGSALGAPSAPAHETITVDAALLSAISGADFEILVNFDSDALISDGLDSSAGVLNSVSGPLGVDNIHVTGVNLNELSDFETPGGGGSDLGDGWTAFSDPAIGNALKFVDLSQLDPVGDLCSCPLTGNVMVASVIDGSSFPHPRKQHESIESPPAYVGGDVGLTTRSILFDAWLDLPSSNGVGYRVAMQYYPWTCPVTLVTGWTVEPFDQGGGFFVQNTPKCGSVSVEVSPGLPLELDSLKIVLELLGDCNDFGTPNCTGPEQTNQSPYWDNIQICLSGTAAAGPAASVDLVYQDVYPQSNTLSPAATADIHSNWDNNLDADPTNANMGDSAVILVGDEPLSEAYLNFRVYPGPGTNRSDAWFSKYGGDFVATAVSGPQDNWARARMDTAEVGGGTQVILGSFSTYDWPDGQEDMAAVFPASSGQKIIRDGVLTPGTTVEYFFSTNFTTTPAAQVVLPDTSGGRYFEFEVLPGYFEQAGEVLAPCLLYVDAFNAGAQVPIEHQAFRNLLGFSVDDDSLSHDNWDRYDYLRGALARESAGDNGMTGYQSMLYRTIVYNTGARAVGHLTDGDAALLQNFLSSDDFGRPALAKGLWLSGNGIAGILSSPDEPSANALLANFAGATVVCNAYREAGCTQAMSGDSSSCVRLDGAPGSDFPQTSAYALRGNGCPELLNFDVLGEGSGNGNLSYVDQDNGETITSFASITNDAFASPSNFGVVIDGFSTHYLRSIPSGGLSEDCGDDLAGIYTRASDVLEFLSVGTAPCDPGPIVTSADAGPDSAPIAVTRLFKNAPNPFNPRTSIRYQLHDAALVTLVIFDVAGRRVRTLVDEVQGMGRYTVTWDGLRDDGHDVSSGVYWVSMRTSLGFRSSTKIVLLR